MTHTRNTHAHNTHTRGGHSLMGSLNIGAFTRDPRGLARVACAYASVLLTRRPRRGPGALAGPDAPSAFPSR